MWYGICIQFHKVPSQSKSSRRHRKFHSEICGNDFEWWQKSKIKWHSQRQIKSCIISVNGSITEKDIASEKREKKSNAEEEFHEYIDVLKSHIVN